MVFKKNKQLITGKPIILVKVKKENPLGLKIGSIHQAVSICNNVYQVAFAKGPNKYLHINYFDVIEHPETN